MRIPTPSDISFVRFSQASLKELFLKFFRFLRTPLDGLFEKLPSGRKITALKKELATLSYEKTSERQTHERREAILERALRNNLTQLRTADATIEKLRESAYFDSETRFLTSVGAIAQIVTIAAAASRAYPTNDDMSWIVLLFAPESEDKEEAALFRRVVSNFLRTRFRFQGDTVARLDENEFAVFLVAGDDLSKVMSRMISEFEDHLEWLAGPDHKPSWTDVPTVLHIGLMHFLQTQSTSERRSPEDLRNTIQSTLRDMRRGSACARFNIPRNQ